jgi:hypothetical protein
MTANAAPDALERRHAPEASAPWIFSRELDAALLVVPYLVALVAFVASGLSLSGGLPRAYAAWGSQFVLGNTTHVVLTFLLLGARRDLLHAAPGQARTIVIGATLTWGVAFGSYYALDRYAPTLMDLFLAFVITLASHHTFSQSKGIWSLYAMRAPAPPSANERAMQQRYVPTALVLVMVRWLFVGAGPGKRFPFIGAVPGLEAPLPYAVTFVLAALWVGFAVLTVRATSGDAPFYTQAKSRYVAASALAVLVMIVVPPWGSVVASGDARHRVFFAHPPHAPSVPGGGHTPGAEGRGPGHARRDRPAPRRGPDDGAVLTPTWEARHARHVRDERRRARPLFVCSASASTRSSR